MGYTLTPFEVEACDESHALEVATARIVNEDETNYFEEIDSDYINELYNEPYNDRENGDPEGWIYVDATMEGANRPVFICCENMCITRV